jgi:hypothetical protein
MLFLSSFTGISLCPPGHREYTRIHADATETQGLTLGSAAWAFSTILGGRGI